MTNLGFEGRAKLSKDLVIMGHSFGGISVLGAAADCEPAKAVIALDPWFYPHVKDSINAADHQKSLVVMTERFPIFVKKEKKSGFMDTFEQME
jgi:dienelactone hydrolase